jgi:hypothetical protein
MYIKEIKMVKSEDETVIKHVYEFNKYEIFSLHDSVIKSIVVKEQQLILTFEQGFYQTDDYGVLTNQLNDCKVVYGFDLDKNEDIYLSIIKYSRKRFKSITLDAFQKYLRNKNFEVLFEFRSDFLKAIMLTGNIGNYYFEFKIHDVKKITYIFNQ